MSRLSVQFLENGRCRGLDTGEDRHPVRCAQPWIGATLFCTDRPSGQGAQQVYLDTPDGMWGCVSRTARSTTWGGLSGVGQTLDCLRAGSS